MQWSDVITTLYLLGHDVTVISDVSDMLKYAGYFCVHKNILQQDFKEN